MAIHDAYTQKEIDYIIKNYPTAPWEQMLSDINKISPVPRDKQSIIAKASALGIKRSRTRFGRFTPDEDALIREVYEASDERTISDSIQRMIDTHMPHRTIGSICTRASKIGAVVRKAWTDSDIKFLTDNYYDMPIEDIARELNRTHVAVYSMVRKLGLRGAPMSMYTDYDIDFIKDHYLSMSDEEIGAVLHRMDHSIKECRRKHGIFRRDPNEDTHYKDILRFVQARNSEWKKASMKACSYKCVLTGEPFSDIHHLYAKNMIVDAALERLGLPRDIDINACDDTTKDAILEAFYFEQDKYPLGVCMKGNLHMMFHALYGFGNNTPEQFYEFAKKFPQNSLCDIVTQ